MRFQHVIIYTIRLTIIYSPVTKAGYKVHRLSLLQSRFEGINIRGISVYISVMFFVFKPVAGLLSGDFNVPCCSYCCWSPSIHGSNKNDLSFVNPPHCKSFHGLPLSHSFLWKILNFFGIDVDIILIIYIYIYYTHIYTVYTYDTA